MPENDGIDGILIAISGGIHRSFGIGRAGLGGSGSEEGEGEEGGGAHLRRPLTVRCILLLSSATSI